MQKVKRYLQRIKDFIIVFSNCDKLEIVEYSDSDFKGSPDDMMSTSGYAFNWLVEQFH